MTESALQKAVQEELTSRGVKWFHVPRGLIRKRKQLSDIPDLICVGFGCVFFIELKSKKGELSTGQIEYLIHAQKNHVPVLVSSSYEEVSAFLDGLRRKHLTAVNKII